MKNLLQKLEIIDSRYQILKDRDTFNLFTVLRGKHDEVNLHSKFITELLNPKGTHRQGEIFLRLFLDSLEFKDYKINENTIVESEKYIGEISEDKTEGGRIDIIIENIGEYHIVIENKIYAGDQENQLLRYSKYKSKSNSKIYYLTLFGIEPSDYSLGSMNSNRITNISYKEDINNWLTLCIEKSAKYPTLRETIIQYQKLINELTGNTTDMEERLEILELLSKEENVLQAKKIVDNWEHVKWHTEFDFWNDFSKLIEENEEYKIMEMGKFSADCISGVVHKKKNRNTWYGIMFKIIDFSGYEICLSIERGRGILYYSVIAVKDNHRIDIDKLEGIAKKLIGLNGMSTGGTPYSYWLGWKHCELKINFEQFSDEDTLLLLNKNHRKDYLKNIWGEIQELIKELEEFINSRKQ